MERKEKLITFSALSIGFVCLVISNKFTIEITGLFVWGFIFSIILLGYNCWKYRKEKHI